MVNKEHSKLQRYILPGLIFQSIVIAGGYGTGAELTQFFMPYGTLGGLLSLALVTFGIWALVCAVTFEFSRVFGLFDYKSLFQRLLGKYWFLYELCYLVLMLLVLAVTVAAAGAGFSALFGGGAIIGVALLSFGVIYLVLRGTAAIERFLSYWSYVLYGVYIIFLLVCFSRFGETITSQLTQNAEIAGGWALPGAKYAFYNLGIIPAVLFSTKGCRSRREALSSGVIAAAIGVIPAILLYIAMSGLYPGILGQEVPVNYVFERLNTPILQYAFQITLFGTLIETGAGFIKAVCDRFENDKIRKRGKAPRGLRPFIAISCMGAGVLVSGFGLTGLVDRGYGTITWGFLAFFVLPMLTIGVAKIYKARKR